MFEHIVLGIVEASGAAIIGAIAVLLWAAVVSLLRNHL